MGSFFAAVLADPEIAGRAAPMTGLCSAPLVASRCCNASAAVGPAGSGRFPGTMAAPT
jgi:hypothetical protein